MALCGQNYYQFIADMIVCTFQGHSDYRHPHYSGFPFELAIIIIEETTDYLILGVRTFRDCHQSVSQ